MLIFILYLCIMSIFKNWDKDMEDICSLFYSKNNIVLGKRIKENLAKFGFEINYSSSLADIVDLVSNGNRTLIFVDKVFKKYKNLIFELTKSKLFNNVLVVFVDDDSNYYSDFLDSNNFFIISEKEFEKELGGILRSCRTYISNKHSINMFMVSDIVSGYLSKLGFSPKHAGYRYIKQCIEYAIQNSFSIGKALYKDTYLFVARKNNGSCASIERNIRNAINQARLNTGFDVDGFPDLSNKKITNRYFLSYLVDKLSNNQSIYEHNNTNNVG